MAGSEMGMGLTYGSMVLPLAPLAPGWRLAIPRHMILAKTIEAMATAFEKLLVGSNISHVGAICGRMRLLTIETLRISM